MKHNRYQLVLIVALLATLVGACAPKMMGATTVSEAPAAAGGAKGNAYDYSGDSQTAAQETGEERMIVRTADIAIVVQDAEKTVEQIRGIVDSFGGYVVGLQLWRDQEQLRGAITVRVPAESLDQTLSQFKGLAVKVERENGSSQDVTEEYSDLGSQLRNLEATEKELLELLATVREKTGKAEDILAVYRELTQIRGQIEGLKGRMQYLERTAAMSSVTVELIPDVLAKPITVGGWRPSETVSRALRALVQALRGLVDAAIWVALYIAPVLGVILIPFAVLWYLWRRRKKGSPVAKG
jgi:hypothetical protein